MTYKTTIVNRILTAPWNDLCCHADSGLHPLMSVSGEGVWFFEEAGADLVIALVGIASDVNLLGEFAVVC